MAAPEDVIRLAGRSRVARTAGLRYFLRRYARNRLALIGLWVVLAVFLSAALAPWVAPADPKKTDFDTLLRPPSPDHALGTDDLGRDILSRIIFGARTSLLAGVISVGLALAIAAVLGDGLREVLDPRMR